MEGDRNEDNLIILEGLEGNPPTTLNATQEALVPYLDSVVFFWWTVWFLVLGIVFIKNIIIPFLYKKK